VNRVVLGNESSAVRGWYSRGYLPHFDTPHLPQAVTFRLADSLPAERLQEWRQQLNTLSAPSSETQLRRRIEDYLDRGHGSCILRRTDLGELVQNALLYFDGDRYALHAWVIMPNHVHALLTLAEGHELGRIMHSWKSFTASAANKVLGRTGAFWQREYFDRYVRDATHYQAALAYIEHNPVSAGLCKQPHEWLFGSAHWRHRAR